MSDPQPVDIDLPELEILDMNDLEEAVAVADERAEEVTTKGPEDSEGDVEQDEDADDLTPAPKEETKAAPKPQAPKPVVSPKPVEKKEGNDGRA